MTLLGKIHTRVLELVFHTVQLRPAAKRVDALLKELAQKISTPERSIKIWLHPGEWNVKRELKLALLLTANGHKTYYEARVLPTFEAPRMLFKVAGGKMRYPVETRELKKALFEALTSWE